MYKLESNQDKSVKLRDDGCGFICLIINGITILSLNKRYGEMLFHGFGDETLNWSAHSIDNLKESFK